MAKLNGRRIIEVLSGLDEQLLEFVSRKQPLKPTLNLLQETKTATGEPIPAAELALKHFLYTTVFTQRRQITHFIKAYSASLSPEALAALRAIHKNPMEWILFGVEESKANDRFQAYDQWINNFQIVVPHDSFIREVEANKEMTFAALTFKHEDIRYSFSLPQPLPNLNLYFVVELFELLDPESMYRGDITKFIRNNYIPFFLFYFMYPAWEKGEPENENHFFWGEFKVNYFFPFSMMGDWIESETIYGYTQYYYKGIEPEEIENINTSSDVYESFNLTQEEFWDPSVNRQLIIYWDEITEKGYFRAHSIGGPDLIREVLDVSFGLIEFDLHWSFPDRLFSFITIFYGSRAPWALIIDDRKPFNFEDDGEDEEEFDYGSDKASQYLDYLGDAYSSGKELDWREGAEQFAIPPKAAEKIYNDLMFFFGEKYPTTPIPEDEESHRINYPKPSAKTMRRFKHSLDYEDSYFITDEALEVLNLFYAHTNNSFDVHEYYAGMEHFFVSLFEDEFGKREGVFIGNALFYILASTTDTSLSVRGLALEVIHLYGHIFLKTLNLTMEEFINTFSRFALSKLCSSAILEVFERSPSFNDVGTGSYIVKTTKFFKRFIELPPQG